MDTTLSSTPHPASTPGTGRALVLGGGGSTGNAWLIGVVAGLYEAGLDVTGADLIIGTSAGSTAAAQITSASLPGLYSATLAAVPQQAAPRPPAGGSRPVVDHLARTARIIADSGNPAEMRRKMGALASAMDAASDDAVQERWRSTVAARLPSQQWPEQAVLITAVDAGTGEPAVFDRESAVELVDAVAASCASGFAYRIGNRQYIDGGYRSNAENADLAAGYARVLVLSPFGGRTRTPAEWGLDLETQLIDLRANGSRVEMVFPEGASEHLFGANAMDLSLRPAAARAGYEQGRSLAGPLAGFWR